MLFWTGRYRQIIAEKFNSVEDVFLQMDSERRQVLTEKSFCSATVRRGHPTARVANVGAQSLLPTQEGGVLSCAFYMCTA